MGQRIEIAATRFVDDSIIVSTDRSLTGTDGEGFDTPEETSTSGSFASQLAAEIFGADADVSRVFVSSNVVVVKRQSSWSKDAAASVERVIEEFFLFYPAA